MKKIEQTSNCTRLFRELSSVLPRAHQKLNQPQVPWSIPYGHPCGSRCLWLGSSRIQSYPPGWSCYVSQLKLAAGFKGTALKSLPSELPEFSISVKVLQSRGITKVIRCVQQVLVECEQ